MKRLLLLLCMVVCLAASAVLAATPSMFNYQGRLTDGAGNPVPDATYSVTFTIYDASVGGAAIWSESRTVTTTDGLFSILLGGITPVSDAVFADVTRYLGIAVGADPEISPRAMLVTVPYAFRTSTVDGASGGTITSKVAIGAGHNNSGAEAFAAGISNIVTGNFASVCGGFENYATGENSFIGGGQYNTASGWAVVTGGFGNHADSYAAAVTGGEGNNVSGQYGFIGGGRYNVASGQFSSVPGGENNEATGDYSFAAGRQASATGNGTFVWNDATGTPFASTGNDQFLIRASGGVGIGTNLPLGQLHVNTNKQYAGNFETNFLSNVTYVVRAVFTGTGTNDPVAVYGESVPQDFFGVGGTFKGGYIGSIGEVNSTGASTYFGSVGQVLGGGGGQRYGLYGQATAGGSGTTYGLFATASGGTTNWAGYFQGNVNVTGTLSKGGGSFKIDHPLDPENKYLLHSFVESPDMMNIYNGNVVTDNEGYATVTMPEYFDALNRDFRYQLTVIGEFAQAIVAEEISGNRFVVRTDKPNVKVSWQVTGVRHDAFANANRIQVEVDKSPEERGRYLHPGALGKDLSLGIEYEQERQMKDKLAAQGRQ